MEGIKERRILRIDAWIIFRRGEGMVYIQKRRTDGR